MAHAPRVKSWPVPDPWTEAVVIAEIEGQTDRASGLIAAEFVNQRLKEAISALFKNDWKDREEDLFSGQGPLKDFSSRINVAHAFGVIGPVTHRDLHLVRRIRNDFAHVIKPIDFNAGAVASRCAQLVLPDTADDAFRQPKTETWAPRDRYLFTTSFVMSRLIGFAKIGRSSPRLSELP